MDQRVKPAPHEIRRTRAENPKMRERDLAAQLGISEAELVAAHCGEGVTRVEPRVNDLLTGLEPVGEVMALGRTFEEALGKLTDMVETACKGRASRSEIASIPEKLSEWLTENLVEIDGALQLAKPRTVHWAFIAWDAR